jgi:Ca2+-binding RTX toxin-like protein
MLLMLTVVLMTIPSQSSGSSAAPIECGSKSNCAGTNGDDIIIGGNKSKDLVIVGHDGNDIINASAGDDDLCGGNGNDQLNGEDGNDRLVGDSFLCKAEVGPGSAPGMDNIMGGAGNDILIHGNANGNYDDSDGKRDLIDCGPGDDTAMLNISIDHDEAVNCEHINPK